VELSGEKLDSIVEHINNALDVIKDEDWFYGQTYVIEELETAIDKLTGRVREDDIQIKYEPDAIEVIFKKEPLE